MELLSVLGLVLIVVRSKFFHSFRSHYLAPKYLLNCLACFGFWAGLIWGCLVYQDVIQGLKLGFQTSAIGWLLNEIFPKPLVKPPTINKE